MRTATLVASLVAMPVAPLADVFTFGDFYEENAIASCAVGFSCRLNFTKTPGGKVLTLRRVACYVERGTPLRIIVLGVADQQGGLTSRTLPLPFTANVTGNGTYYYSINEELLYLMRPNRFPFVAAEVSAQSAGLLQCTITGTLSDK
jgi:hypothetical protein